MSEERPEIFEVAFGGTMEWLERVLATKPDLDASIGGGVTPLIAAMSWQQFDMARAICDAGGSTGGITAHYVAALDFDEAASAPAFVAARGELARLAGRPVEPFVTEQHIGEIRWPGLYLATGVNAPLRFVDAHQEAFRAGGSTLMELDGGEIGLAPTADPLDLLALLGFTADIRGEVDGPAGTPTILATLEAIRAIAPFRIPHFSRGLLIVDFGGPIADAEPLAAAIASLPFDEWVGGGATRRGGDAGAIGRHLGRSGRIEFLTDSD